MTSDDGATRLLNAFLLHRNRMERDVARRVGCPATAADLVQDLFLRLWRRPPQVPELAGGYLLRSARNIATDHQRAAISRREVALDHAEDAPDARPGQDAGLDAAQQAALIRTALAALPERVRHAFLLNRLRGLSYAEIAKAQGVSVSTVEKDMMRALAACRAAIGQE
ncbi:MAG: sigma-70 family RNA polymerase sigma factor [Acetobacteraceae bacterium]|nr:sigma-70 family RNA polymerase sigma factor [Acetobacteraceae bacterium]